MPGERMSTAIHEMPWCFGTSQFVRASIIPQSEKCAPDVQTFWPLTTSSSPSSSARVVSPARSEPAPGSEKSWHHTCSPFSIRRRKKSFCSSVPWLMIVGPTIPIATMNTPLDTRNRDSSWAKIRACATVPPRPPYSAGHVMPAQPLRGERRLPVAALLHVRGLELGRHLLAERAGRHAGRLRLGVRPAGTRVRRGGTRGRPGTRRRRRQLTTGERNRPATPARGGALGGPARVRIPGPACVRMGRDVEGDDQRHPRPQGAAAPHRAGRRARRHVRERHLRAHRHAARVARRDLPAVRDRERPRRRREAPGRRPGDEPAAHPVEPRRRGRAGPGRGGGDAVPARRREAHREGRQGRDPAARRGDARDLVGRRRHRRARPGWSTAAGPLRDGEVAIDAGTARRYHFAVGDKVRVLLTGAAEPFRIVGLVALGDREDLGFATVAAFDPKTAERGFAAEGLADFIFVRAAAGREPARPPAPHRRRGRRHAHGAALEPVRRRAPAAGRRVPLDPQRPPARLRRHRPARRRLHHLQHVHDPHRAAHARARPAARDGRERGTGRRLRPVRGGRDGARRVRRRVRRGDRARQAAAVGAARLRRAGARPRRSWCCRARCRRVPIVGRRRHDAGRDRPRDPRRAHAADRRDRRPARHEPAAVDGRARHRRRPRHRRRRRRSAPTASGARDRSTSRSRSRSSAASSSSSASWCSVRCARAVSPPCIGRPLPDAVRHHRRARARQRDAQPAPHDGDRGGARRRTRARRAGRDLRRVAEGVGRAPPSPT